MRESDCARRLKTYEKIQAGLMRQSKEITMIDTKNRWSIHIT